MSRIVLAVAVVVAALSFADLASASQFSARSLQDARVGTSKAELVAQQSYSQRVVSRIRGSWKVAPRHATCWSHVAWSHVCDQARHRLIAHRWLLGVASRRLAAIQERELEHTTGSYLGAVAYVEHYFGAKAYGWFLRACPRSEGGFGRWVPNTNGSGAGGWMQFMSGTFYGIIDQAIASARAVGMPVPSSARSWYSPLGQALAARQMVENGRTGEWTGATC